MLFQSYFSTDFRVFHHLFEFLSNQEKSVDTGAKKVRATGSKKPIFEIPTLSTFFIKFSIQIKPDTEKKTKTTQNPTTHKTNKEMKKKIKITQVIIFSWETVFHRKLAKLREKAIVHGWTYSDLIFKRKNNEYILSCSLFIKTET